MSLIEVRDLTKSFKRYIPKEGWLSGIRNLWNANYELKHAVHQLSFNIDKGEIVGYIGSNGAGKSTSIKMLTGILVPTSGEVRVAGRIPHIDRKTHVQNIGVVFGQKTQLWWDIPAIESLKLLKIIYKIPDDVYQRNLNQFRELLDLHEFEQTPVRQLSLGQRMRADLAAALLHDPEILFLDEPTIGVDVLTKERLRTFIKEINETRKVTVLLTTHDMSDIEKLCKRIMIIDKGKIIYDGGLSKLREEMGRYRTLVIDLQEEEVVTVSEAQVVRTEGRRHWVRFDRTKISASELIALLAKQYTIRDLTVEEPEIESVVRTIYEQPTSRLTPAQQSLIR